MGLFSSLPDFYCLLLLQALMTAQVTLKSGDKVKINGKNLTSLYISF